MWFSSGDDGGGNGDGGSDGNDGGSSGDDGGSDWVVVVIWMVLRVYNGMVVAYNVGYNVKVMMRMVL